MVGGYTLYFTVPILLHSMGLPAWTGVIAAIVICALVGVLVERWPTARARSGHEHRPSSRPSP